MKHSFMKKMREKNRMKKKEEGDSKLIKEQNEIEKRKYKILEYFFQLILFCFF